MTNEQMIPNRFLKIQQFKNKYAFILEHLNAGRTVYVHTYTGAVKFTKKHIGVIFQTKSGVYYKTGKRNVCINPNRVTAQ